ncbi:hypothetical protein PGH07_07650 [Sulfurovum sp. zt1-1]|uniref:Uncharacterized protein n=1 Tax=Sulfurovum zhangzhouensis TaxID=3019067 RepID=A0ABT7QZ01_9BACT|nr:hypothetical protein [Sulfurovum zhangzhouensis]MDM5272050.1 hypothetical protein [Sulfurovum zhangzhouensis]
MKAIIVILLTLLITGCSSNQSETVSPEETKTPQTQTIPKYTAAAPPKKTFTPKLVQAENYTSEYMYPANKVQPAMINEEKQVEQSTEMGDMTKEECIGMIGQEKFEHYTEMFSGEEAAIKRCTILKAMRNH